MKFFGWGLLITIIAFVIGFFTENWSVFLKIVGLAALIPGLLSGAFVSGDRNRANQYTEAKVDRIRKHKWMIRSLLISAPTFFIINFSNHGFVPIDH